jgi:hypothetical protein
MTDLEKAVAEAHAKGRAEGAAEAGSKLVAAELRAALAGRNVDVDALLEGVNQSRFIGDDGDPDREAIGKWVDRIAPIPEQPENPLAAVLDLGQGQRSGSAMALNGDPLERALKSKLGIT